MGRLDGKVAVITGAARGIGKADALLFAQEGAAVVISDIDPEPLEETAREIAAAGGKVAWCVADVTKPEDTDKLMDTAVEKFGDLNILVNNAGITRDALIHRMTDAQWDICIDTILKGTFNCIRSAAKYFRKEGHGGKIINVASVVGLMGNIGQINYSAAKAGIIGLTKTVAKEWASFGVTCNAIAYGFVHTRLTGEKESGEIVAGEKVGIPKKVRESMLEMVGGKAMTPEEAARPVLFLASSDADYITGHVLNVSAGMYM
ncbi:MAG TPA: SDR family NAD(P)-dependent oxidoreductase [Dehalococcoidia bacterium]|jgi:3-oxoacyl-[acyl-carrier protein] reductase|nr:SDR family NAD(P)-dependent oxidoreductase [Dehalococcoidia bacterium]